MRVLPLAALAALMMTAPVLALCVSVPEDSAWQAAQQKVAHTLCLQRELDQATADRVELVRWKAQLEALAARTELMLQQQRAAAQLMK